MAPLAKLSTIALMIVSGAIAAPWDTTSRHMTHRARSVGPQKAQFQSYHPPSTFETFGKGIDHPLTKRGVEDASSVEAAKAFLESKLGVSADAISYKSSSNSDITEHEYFRQQLNGIPIANAVANVALRNNKVVSYGASFVQPKSIASIAAVTLTKDQAIAKAEAATGSKYNQWPTTLEYFAQDSDHVVLSHVVQVQNDQSGEWYEAFVDASTGEVVNLVSFAADASYRVDTTSSPNGWHQDGTTTTTDTSGNNVITYKGSTSGTSSQSSATNNYDYTFDPAAAPSTDTNVDAARVNAFYVANMIHDVTYRYGFDEASFNFQQNNNNKGGGEKDRVQISVQDASGTNNANFATPPDGHPISARGFSDNKNDPSGTAGNIVALRLFIDGLKLQPCNPTFISARDAILQADTNRYSGANKCTLWAAFAKRGLGTDATTAKKDSTTVPSEC
ncbi:hypothetical protein RSAG8_09266, partial [Rhizoctonia solani AG-8 WAC10335]